MLTPLMKEKKTEKKWADEVEGDDEIMRDKIKRRNVSQFAVKDMQFSDTRLAVLHTGLICSIEEPYVVL